MAKESKGGMMVGYEIKLCPDKKKGLGVFATQFIPKGTLVWKYDPRDHIKHTQLTLKQSLAKLKTREEKRRYLQYCYTQEADEVLYELDNGKFTNHSRWPNTGCVYMKDPSKSHNYALEDICAGEEITEDYEQNGSNQYPTWFYPLAKEYDVWLS